MTHAATVCGMRYLLDLGNGSPPLSCRDDAQALQLARLFVALTTGTAAKFPADDAAREFTRD